MVHTGKWWFKKLINVVATGLALFTAGGTLNWTMAWVYYVIIIGYIVFNWHVLHPELQVQRSMLKDGTKKWDMITAPFITIIGPLAMILTAGLDKRFDWSSVPIQIQIFGCLLLLIGASLDTWAIKANKFYSETVRIQYERHHVVIANGPYRLVRHPGYTGKILASIATPLMLGSLIALIPCSLIVLGYVARTILEDVTMQRHFKGYYDYTKKVPYRLLPGIW